MMILSSLSVSVRRWLLALAFAAAGQGQILQDSPELCGRPGQTVPLPEGTVFTTADGFPSNLTLKLKDGTSKTVDLMGAHSILQVCPIAGDRLLVFEIVGRGDGPHVSIVSQLDGTELDRIGSRNPVVSPDQHWLIYRQFYPPNAQIIAEAYMLYDLTKDAAGNRLPELESRFRRSSRRQVYPVTADGFALRHDEKLEPTHDFVSESFFWSPDSKFVAFADWTQGVESIVLVKVGETDLTAYVHPLKEGEICPNKTDLGRTLGAATLHGVEFFPAQAPLPDVWATFSGIRCDEPLRLHSQDFKRAAIEVHKKIGPPKK